MNILLVGFSLGLLEEVVFGFKLSKLGRVRCIHAAKAGEQLAEVGLNHAA